MKVTKYKHNTYATVCTISNFYPICNCLIEKKSPLDIFLTLHTYYT